jgi:hypothetical protein
MGYGSCWLRVIGGSDFQKYIWEIGREKRYNQLSKYENLLKCKLAVIYMLLLNVLNRNMDE